MTDDNFLFIGHSIPENAITFDRGFNSKFVSTSLLNQDLNDVFNSGCGFIFAPKNIVGARSHDMWVNNNAEDTSILLSYSSIPKIDHPQRLIDECLKRKKENLEKGVQKKVYNEVVIDGFEPVGIFCFTDGTESLNNNYEHALKLQERFPHLKIHSFDIMKRTKGNKLEKMKLALLNKLQKKFTTFTLAIEKDDLSRYDCFLEEFEKLKQKGKYDEKDIENIFKKNVRLLDCGNTFPEDLFNGNYEEQEIKYILYKNFNYNIEDILSGKARAGQLNKLKKLFPYRDKLNAVCDGLAELVTLLSKVEVTAEMMEEINKKETINFYTISKVLASKISKNIDSYQTKYNELVKEYQERMNAQEQYKYYQQIDANEWKRDMIKKDYHDLSLDVQNNELEESSVQEKLSTNEKKREEIAKRKQFIETKVYDDTEEYLKYKKEIEEINHNLSILSKHRLLNWGKIRAEKKKKQLHENKEKMERAAFHTDKEKELSLLEDETIQLNAEKEIIESKLKDIQTVKEKLKEQFASVKDKIDAYFHCDSVNEIDAQVERAKEFMTEYDGMNEYYLKEIKIELDEIYATMINQQNILAATQEEKSAAGKGR